MAHDRKVKIKKADLISTIRGPGQAAKFCGAEILHDLHVPFADDMLTVVD